MFTIVKCLVKRHPIVHRIARRLLHAFEPAYRIRDLTEAWSAAVTSGDRASALALIDEMRQLQDQLSARLPTELRNVRFLRDGWTAFIGHTSLLDNHVKARLLGWRPEQPAVILTQPGRIANPFYLNMWRPYFTIMNQQRPARKYWHASYVNEDFFNFMDLPQGRMFQYDFWSAIQRAWAEQGRPPLLTLDEQTRQRGWQTLQSLGVPKDAWFVALHVRESGFHRVAHSRDVIRDADVATYEDALRAITRRGGWVIRCGDQTMKPLTPMPQVIDYAHSTLKADWLDIFLCSQCRFFIGTQSGLSHVPATFGVPTLYTNWVSWGQPPPTAYDFFLPKLCWLKSAGRHATLDEVLSSELNFVLNKTQVDTDRYALIDNPCAEIRQAAEEIMDLTESCAVSAWPAADPGIRTRYDAHGIVFNARIMPGFIERHRDVFVS